MFKLIFPLALIFPRLKLRLKSRSFSYCEQRGTWPKGQETVLGVLLRKTKGLAIFMKPEAQQDHHSLDW